MSDFKIVTPEATTNMVTNPSIEEATTGYTAVGGSVARSTAQARFGVASLAVTPTAGTADGVYYGTVSLTSGQDYTMSVWVLGVAGVPYRIYFGSTGGAVLGTPTTFTGTGEWQEVTVTWTENSTTTRRLYIVKNNSSNTGVFYVDALQCENKSYATTYCDGSLVGNREDGYLWSGAKHASSSTRHAQERKGGRVQDMTSLGVNSVNSFVGGGAAEERQNTEELSLLPGELYQNSKVEARFIDLGLTFKGSTVAELHANRKLLRNAVRQNRATPDQPFVFRYTGADQPLEIDAWYTGGMEQKKLNKANEQPVMRLFCPQPYWRALGERSKALTVRQSLTSSAYILRRSVEGGWAKLGTGMNGEVLVIKADLQRGRIYIGGDFTTAGGTTVNRICYYDLNTETFVAMGGTPGVSGGVVAAIAIAANGDVYIGGNFTSAGGSTSDGLARWNYSAGTWTQFTQGTPGDLISALAFDADGNLYGGGSFLNWNGDASQDKIWKYNGTSFSALGTGMNGDVYDIAVGPDGKVYVVGVFTTGNGVTLNRVGYWNGTTFVAMSSGANDEINTVIVRPSGEVVVGGVFTTLGGSSIAAIGGWNGVVWAGMGSGNASAVYSLAHVDDVLYAGANGAFPDLGGSARFGFWNGAVWINPDFLYTSGTVYALAENQGELFVGFSDSITAIVAGADTATNNGSADTFPRLILNGPGPVYSLINNTTGQAIYFDLTLVSGETAILDLDPQQVKFTSTFKGDIISKILNGSEVAGWRLMPGDNNISLFLNDATATAFLNWPEMYESADG